MRWSGFGGVPVARRRGRPQGGDRWTEFSNCQLWARLEVIRETEGLDAVRHACEALAKRGYWQASNGKLWLSDHATAFKDRRIPAVEPSSTPDQEIVENFRKQYYIVDKKRTKDTEIKERCDFWLAVFRRAHAYRETGCDPDDAMWQALMETPSPEK